MIIQREGRSLVLFVPEGDYEYEWLVTTTDSEPWQWMGQNLAVDTSLAGGLIQACEHAGFVLDSQL